jgi:hypothetical protein
MNRMCIAAAAFGGLFGLSVCASAQTADVDPNGRITIPPAPLSADQPEGTHLVPDVLGGPYAPGDAPGDLIAGSLTDMEGQTGSDGHLGIQYLNGTYWNSARGAGAQPPHMLHAFDDNGVLVGSIEQIVPAQSSAWGYRDGASDGTFLYFGWENGMARHNSDGTGGVQIIAGPAPGGVGTWRALAYDASLNGGAGGFWVASFASDLIAVDMLGNLLISYPVDNWSLYGLAYYDGMLYGHSTAGDIVKIDPATGANLGVIFNVAPSFTGLVAQGGLSEVPGGGFGSGDAMDLAAVSQGTPDEFAVFELDVGGPTLPGQTFLVTERNASTIWEWNPASGSTSVFHTEKANDADFNQSQGSPHGWLAEHFADYFARFDVGSGSGLNTQYTLGQGGRTHYNYPKHIAVYDNSVMVMSRNNGTIWRYSVDGVEMGSTSTGFATGQGLATDGTDLYVSVWDGTASQFLQYDAAMNLIGGPIPNPTGLGNNNNVFDFAYDAASGHWFGLVTIGEGGTGTQSDQVVEFTMGGSVVARYQLPFFADGFGLADVPVLGESLTLCYDIVDLGGGLFEYTFVCETEAGWVPGMGWRWFIFGDEPGVAGGGTGVSPIADFVIDPNSLPVGPWTALSSSGGGHNGPTFSSVLDYWIPATASETLTWKGTSATRVLPGDMLFSTIAGTLGGAVAADFKVATEGCPNTCPCACDFDTSTGAGVCDIFDFLAFQNAFVGGDPCACDIDTSTGTGVCDIFDFLAFQNEFVGGCP